MGCFAWSKVSIQRRELEYQERKEALNSEGKGKIESAERQTSDHHNLSKEIEQLAVKLTPYVFLDLCVHHRCSVQLQQRWITYFK